MLRRADGRGVVASEPLQVIAAPRRLQILTLVWDRELSAGQIAAEFDVSWSAVSQHLTILKTAGFLVERRNGRSRLYRADQAALGSLRAVVEEHWRGGLNRIKQLAEAEQREQDMDGNDR
jgi:DNA-binding transcriptional ArsR family regulator